MSLFITSLNSGSNGNCYYVGNNNEAVLVDVGLSCKEVELRMNRLGLSMEKVKAVFISHEHTDHISGLSTLLKKYKLPVYITQQTLRNGRIRFDASLINYFAPYQAINVGGLKINAFPKFHDACDPHSFMISDGSINIGVFTDIGRVCDHLIAHFAKCHAVFLESNYDEVMLSNGKYPYFLKTRITSGNGHLSNTQALDLFLQHKAPYLSHLLLAHLSKENNCETLVEELFTRHAGNTKVIVATRFTETPVFEIVHIEQEVNIEQEVTVAMPVAPVVYGQMSLF